MMDKHKKIIKSITKQLITKYKPQKIILFGSAVKGNFTKDSDFDFLIVKEDVPLSGLERMRQVRRIVDVDAPCDFLIAKPSEIRERVRLADLFVREIIQKGVTLYG